MPNQFSKTTREQKDPLKWLIHWDCLLKEPFESGRHAIPFKNSCNLIQVVLKTVQSQVKMFGDLIGQNSKLILITQLDVP